MKHACITLPRLLLGTVFTVTGLDGFLHFLGSPPMPPAAVNFLDALAQTGYFMPFLKLLELTGGLMLLSGRFVPLGLLVLGPIILNIFLFHVFLAPGPMLGLALLLALTELYLAFSYFHYYRDIFTVDARPDAWDFQPENTLPGGEAH